MESLTARDPDLLSKALIVWTGWGHARWPSRDEHRLVEHFGGDLAAELLPELHRLESEFYDSDAHTKVADLAEMGNIAARRFRDLHPELTSDAVDALKWCYTFDHK